MHVPCELGAYRSILRLHQRFFAAHVFVLGYFLRQVASNQQNVPGSMTDRLPGLDAGGMRSR